MTTHAAGGDSDALDRFSAAFGSGDVDTIMALMTDDVVFEDGSPGHVRGVDVATLRDGKVAEKLSYVKG